MKEGMSLPARVRGELRRRCGKSSLLFPAAQGREGDEE